MVMRVLTLTTHTIQASELGIVSASTIIIHSNRHTRLMVLIVHTNSGIYRSAELTGYVTKRVSYEVQPTCHHECVKNIRDI
jgi:hypothetical protein